MPSNRFDTSQQQNYVSNFVPLPFQEIAALGEKTNQNFRAGKAAEAELGALGQAIKAAPMYEDSRVKFINKYNTKTKELVDKYHGNYGDPNFQMEVKQLSNDFKSQPEINAFQNTLKSYQDWESQVKDPNNEMNLDFTYDMDPNNSKNFRQRDVVNEGVYNPVFTKYEDYTERAKKVLGDVKDSGYVKELGLDFSRPIRINNGETEVYSNVKKGYVGVGEGRVKELSNMLAQNYAQTAAGKHHLQSMLGANVTYNDLNKAALQGDQQSLELLDVVNKEFADHIFRSNANQIGGQTKDEVSYLQATNRKAAADNDSSNYGRIITTNEQGNPEVADMDSVLSGLGLGDVLDKNGEYKTGAKGVVAGSAKGPGMMKAPILNFGLQPSAEEVVNKGFAKLGDISKKLGLETPVDGNYRKQMYDYALAVAKRRATTSNLQPNTQDNLTKNFLGENSNFHNIEIYEQGNEDSNAKLTNEQAGMLSGNSKITGIDYFGKNQAGWKVAATPKDDKGKTAGIDQALIAIPRDKKFEEETRPVHTISKGALDFSKTGEVSNKYKDQNYTNLQNYADKYVAGKPVIAASSTEYTSDGKEIIRGSFVQNINGEPQLFGIEVYPGQAPVITTLDKIQNKKTEEIQLRGSLNQYVNKLQGKTDPNKTE